MTVDALFEATLRNIRTDYPDLPTIDAITIDDAWHKFFDQCDRIDVSRWEALARLCILESVLISDTAKRTS